MLGEWAKHSYLAGMLATLFIIAKKATLVLAGHILVLHAGDTVDARQLPKGKAAIEVQVGGSLHALGTAQRPVVLLGGKGTLISTKGQLYLQHCTLVGPQPKLPTFAALTGTGIVLNGPATISNCTFTKLSRAIDIQNSDPASPPSIKANGFYENRTAIAITLPTATQATSLDLSCNIFEPGGLNASTSPPTISRTRTGLAWGINVLRGTLGNVGVAPSTTAGSYTFAANVWPANVRGGFARGQNIENMPGTDWKSPTGWTSIASAGNTKYFKYLNEFLGTSLNVGLITPLQALGEREFVLTTNQIVTPPSGISLSDYLALFDRRCDGFLGDPFVAPRSVVGGGNAAARLDLDINSTYLLQNIPNPANTETIIGYNIGHDFKEAYIEIVEAVTGRQKQYFGLKSESAKALTISLKNYPQGLYTYRLVVDGKQAAIKKMLVQP